MAEDASRNSFGAVEIVDRPSRGLQVLVAGGRRIEESYGEG